MWSLAHSVDKCSKPGSSVEIGFFSEKCDKMIGDPFRIVILMRFTSRSFKLKFDSIFWYHWQVVDVFRPFPLQTEFFSTPEKVRFSEYCRNYISRWASSQAEKLFPVHNSNHYNRLCLSSSLSIFWFSLFWSIVPPRDGIPHVSTAVYI